MSSPKRDQFYVESPRRILKNAQRLAESVQQHTQLKQASKIGQLKQLAERRKDDVKMAIEYSRNQNDIFRRLEEEDHKRRNSLLLSIQGKMHKTIHNRDDNVTKRLSEAHKKNDGITKIFHKHLADQEKFNEKCSDQSKELKKKMIEFHKKQMQAMVDQWTRLRKLKTCHRNAERLIQNREAKKEEFAFKTLKELELDFQKNGPKENPELLALSRKNSDRWSRAWETSRDFYDSRHKHYLQTYCGDLDSAVDMQKQKEQEYKKTSERINKFLTKRVQKWSKLKDRVDKQQSVVSEKCLNKINKSLNNSMRQTATTFFDTCHSWKNRNDHKKQLLREIQTQRDNRILMKHLDSSRRNRDEDSLNNTMTDMMMRASFHAREFL